MIATAVTLAILWFVGTMLGELVRQNCDKILAALQGRSFLAEHSPSPARPVIVRFSSRRAEPLALRAPLRAAA